MQVYTSLETDNHASTPPLSFLLAGCPSCHPINSVRALKANNNNNHNNVYGAIIMTSIARVHPIHRMPFLPPNQQCQSTEGGLTCIMAVKQVGWSVGSH